MFNKKDDVRIKSEHIRYYESQGLANVAFVNTLGDELSKVGRIIDEVTKDTKEVRVDF